MTGGVWWRFAAVGLFVAAVAAVALAGPSDHYLYEVNRPSYPGFGRADPPEGTFVDLSAGIFGTCGVRSDGELVCWGDASFGYGDPPQGQFVRVDVWEDGGAFNGCAVEVDASLACWSTYRSGLSLEVYGQNNNFGQTYVRNIPRGEFVDVSVAERYICGLRSDGEVVCWGDNTGHGFGGGGSHRAPGGALDVPEGPFVELHAGDPPCALRASGELVCWSDRGGEWGRIPTAEEWEERFVAVSPGWGFAYDEPVSYFCGIRTDSTLRCLAPYSLAPTPGGEFRQVDHTAGPACGLRKYRTIVCWNYSTEPALDVLSDPPPGRFTQIAVGAQHACAIRLDGTVACWGENTHKSADTCDPKKYMCPD